MTSTILVVNAGSSSVKFSLFENDTNLKLLSSGKVAGIGGTAVFTAGEIKRALPAAMTHEDALRYILDWIELQKQGSPALAVHRVVHGGTLFKNPLRVTANIMTQLRRLNSLAPLHQPHNLAAIDILQKLKPDLPQIACFDTAFHAGHDPLFNSYALPQTLTDQGIRRYGFHGLSYEWIVHVLRRDYPELVQGRVIAAHLGNGASLCALKDGISIDTTMGMTALDGLPMGTRCGSLDAGAVIYMMRELGLPPEKIEHLLYTESGLKGLSGLTNDVKTLLESNDAKARFAIDYFCLKTAQFMGMMAVSLGGIDGIVFTGGIGENAAPVREKILRHLAFLKPFAVHVIPANEERIMAMHGMDIIGTAVTAPRTNAD
jgi:acetate kinase